MAQKQLKPDRLVSAIIPQGFILPKNEKITLCGDASGITKPWSGGGVVWNLKQADILLKNFPDFLKYKREAESFFNFRIVTGKLAKSAAYTAGFNFGGLIPSKVNLDGDFLFLKNEHAKSDRKPAPPRRVDQRRQPEMGKGTQFAQIRRPPKRV